jgi:hypothetical protein
MDPAMNELALEGQIVGWGIRILNLTAVIEAGRHSLQQPFNFLSIRFLFQKRTTCRQAARPSGHAPGLVEID